MEVLRLQFMGIETLRHLLEIKDSYKRYYDIEKNVVQEKAFIPSTKSFAIAEEELGKMVYYNQDQNLLYILAGGKFYKIDLTKDEQTVLAKNLEEGQYTVSADGHLIAYQTSGTINTAQEIKVLNLKTDEENAVAAKSGEAIRPLGFIGSDFVYGYLRQEDVGHTAAGGELFPMYELEIRNSENEVMKTYSADKIYISDVFIEENMMTLNRVVKSGETYTVTSQDYISSNEEKKTKSITLEAFSPRCALLRKGCHRDCEPQPWHTAYCQCIAAACTRFCPSERFGEYRYGNCTVCPRSPEYRQIRSG